MASALTNRKLDVYLLGETSRGQLSLDIGTDAMVAAGPAVAVQKFLSVLMTRKGSDPADPEYGTAFMSYIGLNRFQTEMNAAMAFSAAAADAVSQLDGWRKTDSPNDEEIQSVDIESVELAQDSLTISAVLTTRSEEQFTFLLPVRLTPG